MAQYSNGWISTQLTIVLLKMDETVSVEARIFSLGEVLCCVECDIFNKKSWKKTSKPCSSALYLHIRNQLSSNVHIED